MKLSYLLIIILVLFVTSIITYIKYFECNNHKDKKNEEIAYASEDIYGYWNDAYTYIDITDNNQVSYKLLDGSLDSGRYLPSNNIIILERQGQLSIKYNASSNSITLVNTFVRNTSTTPCIDNSSNDYSSCIETAVDNDLICEGGCDVGGGSCMTRCNLSEVSARLSCQSQLRSSCGNCNGIVINAPPSLFGDYECGPYTGKGTSIIGNWTSSVNAGELISINSDNSVLYQMFDGTQDSGKYNGSNLLLIKQGMKNMQYNASTDTLTISVTLNKINPVYGSWSMVSTDGNLNITMNTDNTFTFISTLYGANRNTYGLYYPSSTKMCIRDVDGPCNFVPLSELKSTFKIDDGDINQAIFTQFENSFTLQRLQT